MKKNSEETPKDVATTTTSQAAQRLNQITAHVRNDGHLSPDKSAKALSSSSNLPADYSDILTTISTLRDAARTPNLEHRGYIRQKQAGKLWVRERIAQLLDHDTFQEVGSVSGTVKWKTTSPMQERVASFTPSNNIQGTGKLLGRDVLLTADDFSIRSGHADGASAGKTVYLEKMAVALKLPMIKLVDGSSGGGSVTTIKKEGWSYLPSLPHFRHIVEQLNMGIPNLGAVLGPAVRRYLFPYNSVTIIC